jgi:SNF2 family DNA or RNA helicase
VAFLPRVKRWIALTGTPTPNGLKDLWGPLYFVDQGARLGKSFTAFQDRWFGFAPGRKQQFAERVLLPHAEAEIRAAIADVCFTIDMRDWFDLREPIVNKIYVDLPPEARKQYAQLEREMFTQIDGHDITAVSAAAKSVKALQLCSGACYVNGTNTEWVEAHDEKIEALRSVVEEAAGAPLLVAYNFRSDLSRLLLHFPTARHLDANPQTIKDWNAGKIPILLLHPASAGHGISLQEGGHTLVFFAIDWNLETHQQVIERIGPMRQMQSGFDRPVFLHYLLARNTIDETVLKRLESKASVQQIFLEALDEYCKATTQPETRREHVSAE